MPNSLRLVCLIAFSLTAAAWAVDPRGEQAPAPADHPLEGTLATASPQAMAMPALEVPEAPAAPLARFAGTPSRHWAFYTALHDEPANAPTER